jgi:predicted transcriptional regulator
MSEEETVKTTVYLPAGDYRRLQALAREKGSSAASMVRDAVSAYAAKHRPRSAPRSLGAAHSGRGDLSERAEELLSGMGRRS